MDFIYKYTFPLQIGTWDISAKQGQLKQILDVQIQDEKCSLWAVVDPEKKENIEARVTLTWTGFPSPTNSNEWKYLKTLIYHGLVYHLFIAENYNYNHEQKTN